MSDGGPVNELRAPGELAARWAVQLLRLPGGSRAYTVSLRDVEADTRWAHEVFARLGDREIHLLWARATGSGGFHRGYFKRWRSLRHGQAEQ